MRAGTTTIPPRSSTVPLRIDQPRCAGWSTARTTRIRPRMMSQRPSSSADGDRFRGMSDQNDASDSADNADYGGERATLTPADERVGELEYSVRKQEDPSNNCKRREPDVRLGKDDDTDGKAQHADDQHQRPGPQHSL